MNMLLLFASLACVVKPYGSTPQPAVNPEQAAAGQRPAQAQPQVDFTPYEKELTALLNEGGVQDRDRLDRLTAAHNLTLALRDGKPSQPAVQAYLDAILEIEQRAEEEVVEEGLLLIAGEGQDTVEDLFGAGEVLEIDAAFQDAAGETGDSGLAEPTIALGDAQARAREQLASGDYQDAMDTLEPFKSGPLWDSVTKGLWKEAVDGFVRVERERAGEMFLAARALPAGDARTRSLREVETLLVGLLTFYPESSYNEPIQKNLDLVRAELAG